MLRASIDWKDFDSLVCRRAKLGLDGPTSREGHSFATYLIHYALFRTLGGPWTLKGEGYEHKITH